MDTDNLSFFIIVVPTKEYIKHLNELKPVDKKFIIEDLDSQHLLIKRYVNDKEFWNWLQKTIHSLLYSKAREEIERKVESWMDENVFSAVERVGENLDMS